MIIERYFFREVGFSLFAVLLLLSLILFSSTMVSVLGVAAEGGYPASVVLELLLLKMVGSLLLVLPLSIFVAVLLAFGRLYRDHEMAAMAACGIGLRRQLLSVSVIALLVGLLSVWLAFDVTPWSKEQWYKTLDKIQAESGVENIVAGRFNPTGTPGQLFYVEDISSDRKTLKNVFAYADEGDHRILISATRARVSEQPSGERYLILEDGRRYEGMPGEADFRILEFERHGVLLKEREVEQSRRRSNSVPSAELFGSDKPEHQAELQWRLSVPVSILLLAMLAVPLSKTAPREGRYARLTAGILIYLIYYMLLTTVRNWIDKGDFPASPGLWWVHGLLLLTLLYMANQQSIHNIILRRRATT